MLKERNGEWLIGYIKECKIIQEFFYIRALLNINVRQEITKIGKLVKN